MKTLILTLLPVCTTLDVACNDSTVLHMLVAQVAHLGAGIAAWGESLSGGWLG